MTVGKQSKPKIIVLGALSAIAEATARAYAERGAELMLVGRRGDRLAMVADDLRARGAGACHVRIVDLAEQRDMMAELRAMVQDLGGVDAVLIFYGMLGDQHRAETDTAHAMEILRVNFNSAVLWALAAARELEDLGRGTLVVISSVAGDRGRRTNYIYGAAKAGLTVLVEGIAHRMAARGARAVSLRTGFVDTPMTEGMKKGGPLWARPEDIAAVVMKAVDRGGPTVYAPWFWRWIMLIIRLLPWPIFRRLQI